MQKMTRIKAGKPLIVGVEFVMLKDWKMQVMQVPKVAMNVGNPKGRVHGLSRAHMVHINNKSGRSEIGCSFDLELESKGERGENLNLKTFCSRATVCIW